MRSYFATVIGTNFDRAGYRSRMHFSRKSAKQPGQKTESQKNYWKRPRPYTFDKSLLEGEPEASYQLSERTCNGGDG